MPSINTVGLNNVIQTSGNSTTTILEREIAANTSGFGVANILMRRPSDGSTKYFPLKFAYSRNGSGLSVSADPTSPLLILINILQPLTLAIVTVDVSGNNVRIRVTGLLSTSLNWEAEWNGTELVDD